MKMIQNGLLQLKILGLQNGMQNVQSSKKLWEQVARKKAIEHKKNFISSGKIQKIHSHSF